MIKNFQIRILKTDGKTSVDEEILKNQNFYSDVYVLNFRRVIYHSHLLYLNENNSHSWNNAKTVQKRKTLFEYYT